MVAKATTDVQSATACGSLINNANDKLDYERQLVRRRRPARRTQ